jgi:geranylgeranyl reductase family protein
MRSVYDVVVVGAGPAGSATSALLAARGWHVALLDRATFPRPKACAEYLGPGAVAALERLGVLPAVCTRGAVSVRGMRIVGPSGASATGRFAGRPGLALARERLDQVLLDHAAARGAEVFDGSTVEDLAPDGAGWSLGIRRGRGGTHDRVRAGLVIGADGLHSRVARRTVGTRRPTSRRIALVTHYGGIPGITDVAEMHVTAFGYVGLAPVGEGVVNLSVVTAPTGLAPSAPPAVQLDQLLARVPDLARRLAAGRRLDGVRGAGPFGGRARRAAGRRLLLVGDAAGFYDPFTGDGIWAALRGAELAAAAARRPDRLGSYRAARRRAFAGKWVVERLVSTVVSRPAAFDRVVCRLARRPPLLDTLLGITGHALPAVHALNPGFLLALAR